MRGLSDAQRAKLLFFVTGSPRVPVGGFERSRYSAGPERFVVERAGVAGGLGGGGEGAGVVISGGAGTVISGGAGGLNSGDASRKAWPLPSSHACTSTLHLPPYPDRATLERKLVYAIE